MRWRTTRPRWLITWRGAWRRAQASRGNRASWGRTPVLRPTVHVGLFPLRSGSWRTRVDLEVSPTHPYFPAMRKSSKWVMPSALVHRPTLPGWRNVESSPSNKLRGLKDNLNYLTQQINFLPLDLIEV